jgi:hypothetical protein
MTSPRYSHPLTSSVLKKMRIDPAPFLSGVVEQASIKRRMKPRKNVFFIEIEPPDLKGNHQPCFFVASP